ncbi:conserved hypothetical protein [Desulfarculus baarsii DSM 2075]|uniref:Uncharacterized protein n=1 Tax=Desulfarculus baarsii (strain ATCC 33931 / DSM 2075 / LMG 7858 / VKM B-1802 / 2st14) TaxID=644282 RepID=E1QHL5_DESB2|nr:hypothetical protein [Desulfarculus baarsii]ADK85058.1 conserved hypothetical protein [Desulfarculus baarsii DSM 2075]
MARLWLRIEGQNFQNTIDDTDDLSTLRGGSRALLELPGLLFQHLAAQKRYNLEQLYTGASEGLALITTDDAAPLDDFVATLQGDVAAYLQHPGEPLNDIPVYLTVSHDVAMVPDDDRDQPAALARLNNRIRRQQFQKLTVDPLPPASASSTGRPCQWDLKRPAACEVTKRSPGEPEGDVFLVSASVRARFRSGRDLRQKLYERELGEAAKALVGENNARFANSFAEIVANPPPGLPKKIANKMALLYMDGNKFGKIRAKLGVEAFSGPVLAARKSLLSGIVEYMGASVYPTNISEKTESIVPFETLGWGGDESWMVLPAWEAVGLLLCLEQMLGGEQWRLPDGNGESIQLTYGIGVVFCHCKTPIREVRRLAKGLADHAKKVNPDDPAQQKNVLQYQVLLGIDPPVDMTGHRQGLYGRSEPAALTLGFGPCQTASGPVDGFADLVKAIKELKGMGKGKGMPYGRLLRLLDDGIAQGLLTAGDASQTARTAWLDKADEEMARYGCPALRGLCHPHLGYADAHPLMPLINLTQLWEYVEPAPKADAAGEAGIG